MSKERHKTKVKGAAPCPNPLFVDWLTEWKEEAARKEQRTHYTYGKALRSLKKFPLTLYSGKECKLLEGFGDKLCKMIDDRLEQHLSDLGTGQSAKEVIDEHKISLLSGSPGKQLNRSRNQARKKERRKLPQSTCFGLDSGSENESMGADTNQVLKKQNSPHLSEKAVTSTRSRDYVPQKNSGAHALLVVLYRHQQEKEGVDCFMTKRGLMTAAQPLSTKSFTIPDPGSHYTAWSSMGTLLKKELVTRQSCPAQYRITASGSDLARRLLLAENSIEEKSESQNLSPQLPFCPEKRKDTSQDTSRTLKKFRTMDSLVKSRPTFTKHRSVEDLVSHSIAGLPSGEKGSRAGFEDLNDDEVENFEAGFLPEMWEKFGGSSPQDELLRVGGSSSSTKEVLQQDSSETSSFSFVYINESGQEVAYKDDALVCIDDEISVGFLVKAKYEDLLMSGKRYKLDITKLGCGDFVFAYLADEDAPHASTSHRKPITEEFASLRECESKPRKATTSAAVGLPKTSSGEKLPISSLVQRSISASIRPQKDKNSCSGKRPETIPITGGRDVAGPSRLLERKASSCGSTASMASGIQSLSGDSQNIDSQSSALSLEDLGEPDFVFPPGTFDVVLYVDNHEYYRGTNHNEEMLIKELDRNGVNYKVCNLQIGDFLWVARQRQSDASNPVLVLDYIIERKRMDDLASSIIDGRFKEQKFRLRGCGISNPIYLVEDYGSMQHFSIPEETLNQAIINTQVIEGFFVKRTRDTKETAAYLFLMTRYLESIYKSKSLLGYRRHFKKAKESTNGLEERLMVFDVFNESSAKTKALTVSEMFGKHLMQLHGLTAEKATAILDLYPTPKSLFNAYQKCANEKERSELLADLKYGITKRNFGKQLSKAVGLLYYSSGQLP